MIFNVHMQISTKHEPDTGNGKPILTRAFATDTKRSTAEMDRHKLNHAPVLRCGRPCLAWILYSSIMPLMVPSVMLFEDFSKSATEVSAGFFESCLAFL